MARNGQSDLFLGDSEPDLFGAGAIPAHGLDPDRLRAQLVRILAEVRAAHAPLEPTRATLYRTIFPQLTLWLPEDEGAQLRFEFQAELARLEAA
jgi:hypothetical protein